MNSTSSQPFHSVEIFRLLGTHRRRWIIPATVIALAAILFAAVHPATWEASQALIVRNEASGNHEGPGKFSHADQMKTLQETILELARSRGVLEAALTAAGPTAGYSGPAEAWPSPRDVDDLREALRITPPKGAEFGQTEVFYLAVKDRDRQRAMALAGAVCDQLDLRSRQLRDERAQSMIQELVKTVHLAKADLDESTARLRAIEKEVGPDLAELRILNDATTGDSSLRRTEGEICNELRQARATHQVNTELLALLKAAQNDPGRLMAAPNRLLESQPSLRRLKDGLVDAQLHTAGLAGKMSEAHPAVQAARESEREIGRHLHDELAIAIRGVEVELRLDAERIAMLEERLGNTTGRLGRLADLRAPYANLVAEVRHHNQLVEEAGQNLAQARATQASAGAASLISRIDTPDTGTRPLGPGRATIALLGVLGGLAAGVGIVLLSGPSTPAPRAAAPEAVSLEAAEVVLPQTPETAVSETIETSAADPRRVPTRMGRAKPVFEPRGALSLAEALRRLN